MDVSTDEPKMTRLSVNINVATAVALKEIAKTHRCSTTEAVRRSIAVAKWIEDAVAAGGRIQVVDEATGAAREAVFV